MRKNTRDIQNNSIAFVVSVIGVIFGFGGMSHGFFEILQGNAQTTGFIINAIGPAQQMWEYGNEPAFSIIPNYLITGILAMLFGSLIIVFSIRYIHTKYSSSIFIILFVILFLVGGGIAQIIFFTYGYILATRIHKPLKFLRKIMPLAMQKSIRHVYKPCSIVSAIFIIFSIEIAIFGFVPRTNDSELISRIMIICVFISFVLLILSSLSAISNDIRNSKENINI
ncbi:MAG: hypothetical protein ABH890_03955 [Bacillota bacterium]